MCAAVAAQGGRDESQLLADVLAAASGAPVSRQQAQAFFPPPAPGAPAAADFLALWAAGAQYLPPASGRQGRSTWEAAPNRCWMVLAVARSALTCVVGRLFTSCSALEDLGDHFRRRAALPRPHLGASHAQPCPGHLQMAPPPPLAAGLYTAAWPLPLRLPAVRRAQREQQARQQPARGFGPGYVGVRVSHHWRHDDSWYGGRITAEDGRCAAAAPRRCTQLLQACLHPLAFAPPDA